MTAQSTAERAWVDVELPSLVANARAVQAVARGARLLPMVKADAYGLGAAAVVRALEPLEPWGYGVATVPEGVQLRELGIVRPILVLTPAGAEQAPEYDRWGLRAVLDRPAAARAWPRHYHLEVDTGMGRCGVRWDDEPSLRSCFTPQLEGAFTHFYAADDRPESVELQWQRFEQALTVFPRRPALVHAANSAGAWRLSTPQDLVRPGIYLYGSRHAPDLPTPRPVAAVRARVVSLRTIPAGASVSYGGEWIAPQETRVATLGIGYADGVFRSVQGRGQVLLGGRRRPIVGRITMDFLMVALADEDAVEVGDIATLVGRDGDAEITIDEFAAWAGTNGYEALARLGARLPRRYA